MDIAAISVSMKQDQLSQQVGLAIFKKTMDLNKTNSEEFIKALEQSVSPYLGGNVDIKV